MKTVIAVATHKQYWMPEDELYLPVFAGTDLRNPEQRRYIPDNFAKDNQGDNISIKNKNYCELTVLYWAWKNIDADYIGLAHYRRHFRCVKKKEPITGADIEKLLDSTDVILPRKRTYFIETNYTQYAHAHFVGDLEITKDIIREKHPEYLQSFNYVMKKTGGHRFNMFIMKKDLLCRYCEWLFSILFELENRLDITGYSDYDARVYGFIGERLLDVWLDANKIKYMELPYLFTEKENWPLKIYRFLKRKAMGKTKS